MSLMTGSQLHLRVFLVLVIEKLLRHVAMAAKILDDNKPKTSLKK